MTPMAEDRTTLTWRSGSLILSEMAARNPALPPPTTRMLWIMGVSVCERNPNRVLRALVPAGLQLGRHPRAAVPVLHLGVDLLDGPDQFGTPLLGRAVGPGGPDVVPAGRHLQRLPHPGDGPLAGVIGDEPEAQLGGLAKYAALLADPA